MIRPTEANDWGPHAVFSERLEYTRAEAARDGPIFERDDELSGLGLGDE